MNNKERLLDLISKKDKVSKSNYDEIYEGLEELHYLLNSLKSRSDFVNKIIFTIDSVRFHGMRFAEKIAGIKARLEVFRRYEIENIEFE